MVGVRVKPDLRKRLDAAARKNKWSLTQEAESRLEQSFYDESILARAVGSPELLALCAAASWAVKLVEEYTGKKWTENEETHQEARRAAAFVFAGYGFQFERLKANTPAARAALKVLEFGKIDERVRIVETGIEPATPRRKK